MASSRIFWLSFVILGASIAINSAAKFLGGDRSLSIIAMGASGLGIVLIGLYGTLRPEEAGGPTAGSPLTYGAIIAALVFAIGLGLQLI